MNMYKQNQFFFHFAQARRQQQQQQQTTANQPKMQIRRPIQVFDFSISEIAISNGRVVFVLYIVNAMARFAIRRNPLFYFYLIRARRPAIKKFFFPRVCLATRFGTKA